MTTLRIEDIAGKPCQFEGCDRPATVIACGRETYGDPPLGHLEPAFYCDEHARTVANQNHPEYIEDCPNCGCVFGVN
jgi:hypothetical protein